MQVELQLEESQARADALNIQLDDTQMAYEECKLDMRELSDKCATAQVRQRHGEAQRRKAFEMLQEVRQQAERRGLKEERLREEQYVLLARLAELEQGFGPLINEPGDNLGSARRALSSFQMTRSASSAAAFGKHPQLGHSPPPVSSFRSRPIAKERPRAPALNYHMMPPMPGFDYGVPTKLDLYAQPSTVGMGRVRNRFDAQDPSSIPTPAAPVARSVDFSGHRFEGLTSYDPGSFTEVSVRVPSEGSRYLDRTLDQGDHNGGVLSSNAGSVLLPPIAPTTSLGLAMIGSHEITLV